MKPLSRRTLLRGAGTAMALPLLEAMTIRGHGAPTPPPRLIWMYVPNGIHMPAWTPAEEGPLPAELPPILAPLKKFRGDLSVLSGLAHHHARANGDGPGDHARAAAVWLTGVQPLKTDGAVRLGVSADRLAARQLGETTRFRSLELGCEAGRTSGQCDSGYACAYSGHIAWDSASTPAAKEVSPRALFDRLFRGGLNAVDHAVARERAATRGSVLDFVRADARKLERRLGQADRDKLREYQSGVRELERRIELAVPERVDEVPDELRPPRFPEDLGQHARLMADLIGLAFATDTTRVATLMVANEGSNRAYRNLDVREGHHTVSHHGGDETKLDWIQRINHYHVEMLGHLLGVLADVREGDARLLDHTMVVYGSNIADGNSHAHHDLPTLLAGGRKLGMEQGRHMRWPTGTPLMNLHLALLARAGVSVESLGDSAGRLEGI
jgi:Protein of unknown function (DUF1552)